ncbi:MAG: 2-hydroxyacid dehydrogenase [Aeropyrum sp.]|nr:2-hydroxyacid dehydrogenase [Aeropyrum sp.]MCE4616291.1 2-hydroxyacid dehydrogenase [Aeropyrum sp.]
MVMYDVVVSRRLVEPAKEVLAGYRVAEMGAGGDPYKWSMERLSREGARVFISVFTRVDNSLLNSARGLELIITTSSGYDHIDVDRAEELGICVANQPEVISEAVAEYVIAAALSSLRQLVSSTRYVLEGLWYRGEWPGRRGGLLYSRTIGILGLGRIGSIVAGRFKALGAGRILYWSRRRKPELELSLGAEKAGSLEDLFRESDIVVNLLPLNRETKGIITYRHLSLLKPGSIFINAGRGATVDEKGLLRAAAEREDITFVLDVYPEEPIDPSHKLVELARTRENIILTPHIAGSSKESHLLTQVLASRQARLYLETGNVWNPVNKPCRQSSEGPPPIERLIREYAWNLGRTTNP